jgi:membrane protease YdiL (CAAX protease family)
VCQNRRRPGHPGAPFDGSRGRSSSLAFWRSLLALSLPFWIVGAFVESPRDVPMDLPIAALMFPCPAIAACWALYRDEGRAGPARLWRGVLVTARFEPWWWYVVSATVIPSMMLVTAGLVPEDPTRTGAAESWPVLLAMVPAFLVSALLEEVGWMGFLFPSLGGDVKPVRAAFWLGAAWGFWHLTPLVQAGHGTSWTLGWFLGTVAARVLIVWLYVESSGSIAVAVVCHASINVSELYVSGLSEAATMWVSGVLLSMVAAAVATRLRALGAERAALGETG